MSTKEDLIAGLNDDLASDEAGHARQLRRILKGL